MKKCTVNGKWICPHSINRIDRLSFDKSQNLLAQRHDLLTITIHCASLPEKYQHKLHIYNLLLPLHFVVSLLNVSNIYMYVYY